MKALSAALLVMAAIVAAACQSQPNTSATQGASIDQASSDVTVLQAWLSDKKAGIDFSSTPSHPDIPLNYSNCIELHRSESTTSDGRHSAMIDANCTAELERAASTEFSAPSPSINDALQEYVTRDDGTPYTRSGLCEVVEFRTIIKDEALDAPAFAGIGFFYSTSEFGDQSTGKFIPKDRLHVVGHVTLKDGKPATVHRFIAQGMCFGEGGNGDSIYHRHYIFKPFARFSSDADATYNNWDEVSTNYVLGLSNAGVTVTTFDRQNDLLQR